MGKLKLSDAKKARPIPISLKPKHLLMLADLENYQRNNRSRIIQMLIEREYNKMVESAAGEVTEAIEEGTFGETE